MLTAIRWLNATQVFCKMPRQGKSVPWHQDGPYWPIVPLRAVSAWVALDDTSLSNGGIEVIPGSHRSSPSGGGGGDAMVPHVHRVDEEACISYVADPLMIDAQLKEAGGAVAIELQAGQVTRSPIRMPQHRR